MAKKKKSIESETLNSDQTVKETDQEKKELIIDKVEWFDDRFYKLEIPLETDETFLKNIPQNFISKTQSKLEIYLPSVTTIRGNTVVKPFLSYWRGEIGNERADQIIGIALNKGSRIHTALDKLSNGVSIVYQNLKTMNVTNAEIETFQKESQKEVHLIHDQEEMIQIVRFKRLLDIINPNILETESVVYNLIDCYAGQIDQVWEIKKDGEFEINTGSKKTKIEAGIYLIDFKTGKTFDDYDTSLQLSAYVKAHHLSEKIAGTIGIHLNSNNKTGIEGVKIYLNDRSQIENYYEKFQTYKKIFFYNAESIIPKNYEIPAIVTYEKETDQEQD